ncbi:MAG: hypothetical protein JWN41_1321 [Thermoleophilia bacterium]|nr:hypothetical protein [Thermoleophilia bacterium]
MHAQAAALAAPRGRIIILCGLPGSGKTTFARRLEAAGAIRFSPDEWVLFMEVDGADEQLRHRIDLLALDIAERAAISGATVVLELGFWLRRERDATRLRARAHGVAVELHHLDVPLDELLRRVALRNDTVAAPWQQVTERELREWAAWFEAPTAEELALFDPPGVALTLS